MFLFVPGMDVFCLPAYCKLTTSLSIKPFVNIIKQVWGKIELTCDFLGVIEPFFMVSLKVAKKGWGKGQWSKHSFYYSNIFIINLMHFPYQIYSYNPIN